MLFNLMAHCTFAETWISMIKFYDNVKLLLAKLETLILFILALRRIFFMDLRLIYMDLRLIYKVNSIRNVSTMILPRLG